MSRMRRQPEPDTWLFADYDGVCQGCDFAVCFLTCGLWHARCDAVRLIKINIKRAASLDTEGAR